MPRSQRLILRYYLLLSTAVPLPASEAHEYPVVKLKKEIATEKLVRVHGQRLRGEMIPTVEDPIDNATSVIELSGMDEMSPPNETDSLLT